ncbi:nucleoside triphosphate hydrolase [Serinicoccus chungangensis]|uniref:Nucleoside triphosphate hydrolase n=1 Tax=Serinicoccus chungangensis TaxID=767452 RepID=A0A0W8IBU9_9MICO|nr:nucleoside/nucleotide kinase family protein [Serinicoccus chungangensis]KUG57422.1 nucleoside triphosphate hydrolase [Serinicoccus chungangensis]
MTLAPDLLDLADALVPGEGRGLLGIVGLPGSGKSTFAEELLTALAQRHGEDHVGHVPMDGFHLADAQLERLGLTDRKGAPETFDAEGYAALLTRLREDTTDTVYAPGFERTLEQPLAAALAVLPSVRLVVTEGNYLLDPDERWRAARARLNAVWSVEVDEEQRHTQLVARHVEFGKTQEQAQAWVERVDEANARRIRKRSEAPDRVVRCAPDGTWQLA